MDLLGSCGILGDLGDLGGSWGTLGHLGGLYQDNLRNFEELSKDFFRTFSELSLSGLHQDFLKTKTGFEVEVELQVLGSNCLGLVLF